MTQPKLAHQPMTANDFISWSAGLEEDATLELIAGEVVAMAPERASHSALKTAVGAQFHAQLKGKCVVHFDGLQVKLSDDTVSQPDVLVHCAPIVGDPTFVTDPTIVVEVLSPSTRNIDLLRKMPLYLELASLVAAILVDPKKREVLVYRQGGQIAHPEIFNDRGETVEIEVDGLTLTIDLGPVFDIFDR